MAEKKFNQQYYSLTRYDHKVGRFVSDQNGFLFADGRYRTKILPEDLPKWYVYDRFYANYGWMSTKGITDMIYRPSKYSNHYLKDDCLMIAYGGKITHTQNSASYFDDYDGVDQRVWGNGILAIVRAAAIYSDYGTAELCKQLQDKWTYVHERFPDEFLGKPFDVAKYMQEPREEWYDYKKFYT